MGRTADDPGNPRGKMLTVRLTDEQMEELDRIKGEQSRAEFIRILIAQESRKLSRTPRAHKPSMGVPAFLRGRS